MKVAYANTSDAMKLLASIVLALIVLPGCCEALRHGDLVGFPNGAHLGAPCNKLRRLELIHFMKSISGIL